MPSTAVADSPAAWLRLLASVALMVLGGCGMYVVVVVLPTVQAEFGVARGEASLPYTLTMIGFGIGGMLMGRLADRYGIMVADVHRRRRPVRRLCRWPACRPTCCSSR